MISPPAIALRRRSEELRKAAEREYQHDPDAAALLLFYAAECGLKSIYMIQNNLKDTSDSRGTAIPASKFVHNILRLADVLRMPRSAYAPNPGFVLLRTGRTIDVSQLHQAWRYGERIMDTDRIYAWLQKILDWIKRNR